MLVELKKKSKVSLWSWPQNSPSETKSGLQKPTYLRLSDLQQLCGGKKSRRSVKQSCNHLLLPFIEAEHKWVVGKENSNCLTCTSRCCKQSVSSADTPHTRYQQQLHHHQPLIIHRSSACCLPFSPCDQSHSPGPRSWGEGKKKCHVTILRRNGGLDSTATDLNYSSTTRRQQSQEQMYSHFEKTCI